MEICNVNSDVPLGRYVPRVTAQGAQSTVHMEVQYVAIATGSSRHTGGLDLGPVVRKIALLGRVECIAGEHVCLHRLPWDLDVWKGYQFFPMTQYIKTHRSMP